MSKIVLGVHFGTFQSQYQILSSKDNFLQKLGHPFRGGTVLFNPNQTVGSVMRSKSLTYTKIPQKPENLLKRVPRVLFGTSCSQYQVVSSKEIFL